MIIKIIAAMAKNRVIGNKNTLPRHYPEDLKHFKELTNGETIVMGRKTYESLGKALPNRRNIVLTSRSLEGIECYTSLDEMLKSLQSEEIDHIRIIGGEHIYKQFIGIADYIHLTLIKKNYEGDTYFPFFEDQYEEIEREVHQDMDFITYKKK